MSEGLAGRRVLVVGASAGIGRGIALRAAQDGAELAVVARRKDALAELTAEAGRGSIITADLSLPEDCVRLADEAGAALGEIDVVVFAAATARLRPLRRMTPQEWATTLATNLVGVNLAIAALLPHLRAGALVVVMSSESVGRPFYGLGAYAASKAGVEDTLRAWRSEQPGVRFVTLVVGVTAPSDFASNFEPEELQAAFPKWAAQGVAPSELMQRDEVAAVAVELFAAVLPRASVGMETVVLRSPAPLMGTTDGLLAAVEAHGGTSGG
jgi:NAD(P)-dependent dehydrogenase (short-subunit alcohol dehydrogenase family)